MTAIIFYDVDVRLCAAPSSFAMIARSALEMRGKIASSRPQ